MRGRATKCAIVLLALCCLHCSNRESPRARPTKAAAGAKPVATGATPRLFVLRIEQPSHHHRTYLSITRKGSAYTIEQVNTFASADKDAAVDAAAQRRASRTLTLQPGDAVLRTAAFSELAFDRPNLVRFIGSMQLADSVTRIFGSHEVELAPAARGPVALATLGKLHLYLYLESSKTAALYSFAMDVQSGRVGEVARDDVETFRRVDAFHAQRRTGKLAQVKDLYLELLAKLPTAGR